VKDKIMHRRHLLLGIAGLPLSFSAFAANVAEDFVSGNIQAGFTILNDQSLGLEERRRRFAAFLLELTDLRRVALFLLGRYQTGAAPVDLDAYIAAYKDYIMGVYQSYFSRYSGETLRVTSSRERASDDYIVSTNLVGGSEPTQIDFRIRTDGAKPVLVDVALAGVWLALAERDQFLAVLAQNNGDIKALITHLRAVRTQ
jgi:phospholipid transport system substrate-binding protein